MRSAAAEASAALDAGHLAAVRWSLLFGNFIIGCGVMVVVGTLNDVSRSLEVSVSVAGQLVAAAAVVMCLGAPTVAGLVGGFDRRSCSPPRSPGMQPAMRSARWRELCGLLPLRALTVLGAAVFTPQAAAAVGALAPPAERGKAITFIFIGWSVASVVGMPLAAWLGDAFGWRVAFFAIAALGAVAAAWFWVTVPGGLRPVALTLAAWKSVFGNRVLMAMVFVTAVGGAGQFTLFSYFAPYFKSVLARAPPRPRCSSSSSACSAWSATRWPRATSIASVPAAPSPSRLVLMAISLLLWPLAHSVLVLGIVLVPWALACFSSQSMQQARLNAAAPALAPALMALNTSAIYLGQAAGASSGGWLIAHQGWGVLSWYGLAWVLAALALSLWASRARARAAA